MKNQKLVCDKIVDDNFAAIREIGKIAGQDEVLEFTLPRIAKQIIDQGMDSPENLKEETMLSAMIPENIDRMSALITINNYYWGGRQVYKFDETLADLLRSQTKEDMCISSDVVHSLPVDHFFVLTETDKSYGFFVSYIKNIIYITDVQKDKVLNTYILGIIEGKTITEIITKTLEVGIGKTYLSQPTTKKMAEEICKKTAEFMQFIVYLSAINAEITPLTKGAVVKRQAGKREYKPRERSEQSEVGYRIGATIRKSLNSREKIVYVGEHGKGSPKSPHIRRSHFHSYWTGSGDNKELIVKWVNTIFVHGGDDNNSTVHNVK